MSAGYTHSAGAGVYSNEMMNFPMRRQSERISIELRASHTGESDNRILGCTNTPHTIFDELARTPAQEYMLKEGMEKREEKNRMF